MTRILTAAAFGALALVLAAPVGAHAADGYHRANDFEQAKAYCELAADRLTSNSFVPTGNPNFDAGASLGSGLRSLFDHAQNYGNCMVLRGYAHD